MNSILVHVCDAYVPHAFVLFLRALYKLLNALGTFQCNNSNRVY